MASLNYNLELSVSVCVCPSVYFRAQRIKLTHCNMYSGNESPVVIWPTCHRVIAMHHYRRVTKTGQTTATL